MRRKKLSVFAGICAILVMTACGKKSIEDDIGVNTEKKEVSDNKENTELDDKEVDYFLECYGEVNKKDVETMVEFVRIFNKYRTDYINSMED